MSGRHTFSQSLLHSGVCSHCGGKKWDFRKHAFTNDELMKRIEELDRSIDGSTPS